MTTLAAVLYVSVALTAIAGVAVLLVMSRELRLRRGARGGRERLARARRLLEHRASDEPAVLLRTIRSKVDTASLEQALDQLLREKDPERHGWLIAMYQESGLVARHLRLLREAPRWSDRCYSAEVLGLLAVPEAVPPLVAALRDPFEDGASVKAAAAEALAKIRDPSAVPLLVNELRSIDEPSSPRVADKLLAFGSAAVPPLLQLVAEDELPAARSWGARILGRIGDKAAVPALLQRLHDRHDVVRISAAEALGVLADRRAVKPLIELTLRDPAPQVRAQAAGALGKLGDARSMDVLVAALADPDHGARIRALEALEMLHPQDTSPLEGALRDPNLEVRRRAALALERVGYLDARIEELASDDPQVARRAYGAIMELGRAGLVDSIAGAIHHPKFQARALLVQACGELGGSRVGPVLVAAIDEPAWPVRARLAEAIGRLHAEGGAAALAKLLSDPEVVVREHATEAMTCFTPAELSPFYSALVEAHALGTSSMRRHLVGLIAHFDREPTASLLLSAATEDPSSEVRLCAIRALARHVKWLSIEPLLQRLTDSDVEVRMAAVDALSSLGTRDAVEALLRSLPGASIPMREKISEALASGKHPTFREQLSSLVESPDLDIRLGVTWTLGKMADPLGVPYLCRFLRATEGKLRASAAGALGKIPGEPSVAALLTAVEDRDPRARAAVINALAKVGSTCTAQVLGAVRGRLADPDSFVRNRAAIALARLGDEDAEETLLSPQVRKLIDDVVAVVALALTGTDAGLQNAVTALSTPGMLERVRGVLEREDEPVRRAFFERLHLEDPGHAIENVLEERALITQYNQLLYSSQDARGRRLAVEALARIRSQKTLETLADVVASDPSQEVRVRAAQALSQVTGDEAALSALARAVSDPSPAVSLVAVRALGESRDVRFSDALFKRLGDGQPDLEEALEEALALIHQANQIPLIDRMMGTSRPEVIVPCVRVLGRIASPTSLPLLQALLKSRDFSVRIASVRAVARLPEKEAAQALEEATQDAQESVRLAAIEALAGLDDDRALFRLSSLLFDPSVAVRGRLAALLPRFGAGAIKDVLCRLLEDPAASVRAQALLSLLSLGDLASMGQFMALWGAATPETRSLARGDARTPQIASDVAQVITSGATPQLREAAVTGIGALAAKGHEQHVLPALHDPIPSVRIAAVRILSSLMDPMVRQALSELVADPDRDVREAAQKSSLRVVR
ncbi:MAG: HEAT repeat domain-containing protein [Deltaproteobacteria bacterium]|nr:HEAT repeat domain-containing protein [Deltaproteobacteria bacterium]